MGNAKAIVSVDFPLPADATWSSGIVVGNDIYLSGITANPESARALEAGSCMSVYEQARLIFEKIDGLLQSAGANKRGIVKLVVYITDPAHRGDVAKARREYFSQPTHRIEEPILYPVSTLLVVKGFAYPDALVEIEAHARFDM